jgi:hypothetical protein
VFEEVQAAKSFSGELGYPINISRCEWPKILVEPDGGMHFSSIDRIRDHYEVVEVKTNRSWLAATAVSSKLSVPVTLTLIKALT